MRLVADTISRVQWAHPEQVPSSSNTSRQDIDRSRGKGKGHPSPQEKTRVRSRSAEQRNRAPEQVRPQVTPPQKSPWPKPKPQQPSMQVHPADKHGNVLTTGFDMNAKRPKPKAPASAEPKGK